MNGTVGARPARRLFAAALIGRTANEMTAVAVVLLDKEPRSVAPPRPECRARIEAGARG